MVLAYHRFQLDGRYATQVAPAPASTAGYTAGSSDAMICEGQHGAAGRLLGRRIETSRRSDTGLGAPVKQF